MKPKKKPAPRFPGAEALIRRDLQRLAPYQPIVPLEVLSEEAGVPLAGIIKLDGNENPYGCSPRVRPALATYPYYHIYPDPEQRQLREALAKYVEVGTEHIVVGSGSDELIDLLLRLFLEPGDKVINCTPTFGMYTFSTTLNGGQVVEVPRKEDFSLDLAAIRAAVDKRTKVIILASPNNPSGNIVSEVEILELVGMGMVVMVDEAYYEFSGVTVASQVPRHDRLMVLRTFSKWAGLAGLRVGYGLVPVPIAQRLLQIKPPYNVNVAAQVAALEALADKEHREGTGKAIVAERERLFYQLNQLPFIKPWPSQANFLLCTILKGEARRIQEKLRRRGIFVRYFDTPRLANCLRLSVGRPQDSETLLAALIQIIGEEDD